MLKIENISNIQKRPKNKGYEIVFKDGRIIWLTKRRTIVSLLLLIKYGESSEADLARGSRRLLEIKRIIKKRCAFEFIKDHYADANKPFSELWNEEGFTWIHPAQEKLRGNQKYVLHEKDHCKLFQPVKKAYRCSLSADNISEVIIKQHGRCNFCGSLIVTKDKIVKTTFAKDRVRAVCDHRMPVEKGGLSNNDNYQALCFYCNKSKWQICNICELPECSKDCVLSFPEKTSIILPTGENISDRLNRSGF